MINETTAYQPRPDKNTGMAEKEITPRPLSADDVNAGYDAAFEPQPNGEPGEATVVFDQTAEAIADGLHERTTPISEGELNAAMAAEESEQGPLPNETKFSPDENPFAGTSIDPKAAEARVLEATAKMKQEMRQAINDAGEALANGDTNKAAAIARDTFSKMEQAGVKDLPPEAQAMYQEVKDNLSAAIAEKDPAAKSKLYKFACSAADFVPVVGPAKMLVEATVGRTLGGETLTGWKRFLHGAEGAVFLAVDMTGYGAVATKLAKAGKTGLMSAKLITRTAALMRVLKVPAKVYRPLFGTGQFLLRHPKLAAITTRGLMGIVRGRQLRLAKELPGVFSPEDLTADERANVTERPGMELVTPPEYELAQTAEEQPATLAT